MFHHAAIKVRDIVLKPSSILNSEPPRRLFLFRSRRNFPMWDKSQRIMRGGLVPILGLVLLAAGATPFSAGPVPVPRPNFPANQAEPRSPAAKPKQPAHFDHNSKHGGIFFMSMDY